VKKELIKRQEGICFYFRDGTYIAGVHDMISGDVSGLSGDASGLSGDINACEIMQKEGA
jgi:hypothetical protein